MTSKGTKILYFMAIIAVCFAIEYAVGSIIKQL